MSAAPGEHMLRQGPSHIYLLIRFLWTLHFKNCIGVLKDTMGDKHETNSFCFHQFT